MTKFRSKYRIEPNRWIYWDYFAPGKYFPTICINKRECILGKVVSKKMELSEFGEFVKTEIRKIPEYNPSWSGCSRPLVAIYLRMIFNCNRRL